MKRAARRVLVVGGLGAMGLPFVKVLRRHGLDAAILERRAAPPSSTARLRGLPIYRTDGPPSRLADLEAAGLRLEDYSIVVMAVPVQEFDAAMRVLGPGLAPGTLLMDIASTKEGPVRSMLAHTRRGVAVLGAHPLFGPPRVSKMAGGNVVLVETERCRRGSTWHRWARRFFREQGASVTECRSAAEHDRMVAITQVATHFFYLSFARFLQRTRGGVNGHTAELLRELERFATPPYRALLAGARPLLGNAPLVAAIQGQRDAARIRVHCRAAMADVARTLAGTAPERALAQMRRRLPAPRPKRRT